MYLNWQSRGYASSSQHAETYPAASSNLNNPAQYSTHGQYTIHAGNREQHDAYGHQAPQQQHPPAAHQSQSSWSIYPSSTHNTEASTPSGTSNGAQPPTSNSDIPLPEGSPPPLPPEDFIPPPPPDEPNGTPQESTIPGQWPQQPPLPTQPHPPEHTSTTFQPTYAHQTAPPTQQQPHVQLEQQQQASQHYAGPGQSHSQTYQPTPAPHYTHPQDSNPWPQTPATQAASWWQQSTPAQPHHPPTQPTPYSSYTYPPSATPSRHAWTSQQQHYPPSYYSNPPTAEYQQHSANPWSAQHTQYPTTHPAAHHNPQHPHLAHYPSATQRFIPITSTTSYTQPPMAVNTGNTGNLVNPPPPVVVTKVDIASLLKPPGCHSRPRKLLLLLRGLPGSGKSMMAKAIKEAETAQDRQPPRIHSIDDYFMTEVEKEVADEERRGKKRKVIELEYCYEAEVEASYEKSLLKAVGRTLGDGKHALVLVDAPIIKAEDVKEYWSLGQRSGYEVYVVEPLTTDPETCHHRCIHGRSLEDIHRLAALWEPTPPLFTHVDASSLFTKTSTTTSNSPATTSEREGQDGVLGVSGGRGEQACRLGKVAGTNGTGVGAGTGDSPPRSPTASGFSNGVDGKERGEQDKREGGEDSVHEGTSTSTRSSSRWDDMDDEEELRKSGKASSSKRQKLHTDDDILQGLNEFLGTRSSNGADAAVLNGNVAGNKGKQLKGGLKHSTARSNQAERKKVTWADEAADVEGFTIGGRAGQLEEVFLLDGLGPSKEVHEEPMQSKAMHPASNKFKDQVKAEHTSEQQIFRDILFGRRGGLKTSS